MPNTIGLGAWIYINGGWPSSGNLIAGGPTDGEDYDIPIPS
jgi:hypothetical protein